MNLFERIRQIERVDHLIRRKSTGSPKEFASRLDLSERSVYNLLDQMKALGAPIYYCSSQRSYCYRDNVNFTFGFFTKDGAKSAIRGGDGCLFTSDYTLTYFKNFSSGKNYNLHSVD